MRTLTAATESGVTAPVTQPIYLIELGFTTTLRYSTRGDVTWNGYTWLSLGAQVEKVDAAQNSEAVISLANADYSASALVLGEGVRDKTAKIWQATGDGPFAVDDPVEQFNGFMDRVPDIDLRVVIECSSQSSRTAFSPRLHIGPPTFNHLPPAGTKIGDFVLKPRD